jgi:hypothetical protein
LFYKGRIMTLVFRSPKLVEVITNYNPGPGAYRVKEIEQKGKLPSAAFLSKVQREHNHMEESEPGPSSYFKDGGLMHNKAEGGYQVVFNSKIERFASNEKAVK